MSVLCLVHDCHSYNRSLSSICDKGETTANLFADIVRATLPEKKCKKCSVCGVIRPSLGMNSCYVCFTVQSSQIETRVQRLSQLIIAHFKVFFYLSCPLVDLGEKRTSENNLL